MPALIAVIVNLLIPSASIISMPISSVSPISTNTSESFLTNLCKTATSSGVTVSVTSISSSSSKIISYGVVSLPCPVALFTTICVGSTIELN